MKELMLMVASILPEEKVLEDLQDSILNYQVDKNEENKNKVRMHLHLAIMRMMTDGDPKKTEEILQDMKKHDLEKSLFQKRDN